jgi:hypothetical protein
MSGANGLFDPRIMQQWDTLQTGQLNALAPQSAGSLFDTSGGPTAEGLQAPGNINIHRRPVVHNPDGSISTVRSITVGGENVEPAILIPTVIGNRVVSNQEAIDYFRRTGEHLGQFDTPENADAYARSLHEAQATEYLR